MTSNVVTAEALEPQRLVDAVVSDLLDCVETLVIGAHPEGGPSTPRKRYLACRRALHLVDELEHQVRVAKVAAGQALGNHVALRAQVPPINHALATLKQDNNTRRVSLHAMTLEGGEFTGFDHDRQARIPYVTMTYEPLYYAAQRPEPLHACTLKHS